MPERRTSVLLVDDNIDLADVLGEFISSQPDMELVGAAYNGVAAIELIEETQPDVVVLDMVMPHLDGLGVIEYVMRMAPDRRPRIIVASAISTETTAASVVSAGADYYIAKPFDLSTLVDRIRRIVQTPPGSRCQAADNAAAAATGREGAWGGGAADAEDAGGAGGAGGTCGTWGTGGGPGARARPTPEELVSKALRELGVPANLKGYEYLRDAVLMAMKQGYVMGSVTKVVYPAIAKARNTTPSRVERAIRHAIETAWIRGDINILNEVFGHTVDAEKGRPTNSAFIARVADKILIEMKSR
ncbi:MAG: response regulator [Firmicutes bacterium]|jgi:two-component system response regulator (stage 0 sporulation protein A)|nr:response regulator [Bacillota bacterium]